MFRRYDIECLYLAFIPDAEDEFKILYHKNGQFIDFKRPNNLIDLGEVEFMQPYSSYCIYSEKEKIILNKNQVLKEAENHYNEFIESLNDFRRGIDDNKKLVMQNNI